MSLSASFPRDEILMSSPSSSTIAGRHKFTPTHRCTIKPNQPSHHTPSLFHFRSGSIKTHNPISLSFSLCVIFLIMCSKHSSPVFNLSTFLRVCVRVHRRFPLPTDSNTFAVIIFQSCCQRDAYLSVRKMKSFTVPSNSA